VEELFSALAPVFGLILLGYVLKRRGFPGEGFWFPAEKLTYYLLLPALLVESTRRASLGSGTLRPALAVVLAVLALSGLLFACRRRLKLSGPTFTSVVQGSIRPNTYVGLAATAGLLGAPGLAHAAVILALMVPLVNILSVSALCSHGDCSARRPGIAGFALELAKNPLILAILIGLALNASGLPLPGAAVELLDILGQAALPLGLLAVGAGLSFAAVGQGRRPILVCLLTHLVLLPALTIIACLLLGASAEGLTTAILFTAIPTAPSAYILARQLGGDHALMAAVITAQTVAAAASLPLILALFS
jgi:predicted permease